MMSAAVASASTTKVSLYGPSMQAVGHRMRLLSTSAKTGTGGFVVVGDKPADGVGSMPRAADVVNNTLQFPMPGTVNAQQQFANKHVDPLSLPRSSIRSVWKSDLFAGELNRQQQLGAVKTFSKMSWSEADSSLAGALLDATANKQQLHCIAVQAPQVVRKEFNELFPNRDLSKGDCTIVTFAQQTDNDMTAWNTSMEAERDLLTAQFIEMATLICDALKKQGYWADFIDPSSGRPYLGAFTNDTLFETDSRYRHMGIRIEDLGCCKVVRHERWGHKSFVSSLFTNAPTESPEIQQLLNQFTQA